MSEAKGYVWGPINAEDLAPVPASRWVVTSGMTGVSAAQGRLYAVDVRDHSCNEIFPYLTSYVLDEERFGSLAPLDPLRIEPHGIDVVARPDGVGELYVVNHGWRESVEVFEIDVQGARPTLRWIGAAVLPSVSGRQRCGRRRRRWIRGEHQRAAPRRARSTASPVPRSATRPAGSSNGHPGAGWSDLPGTAINSANGVAVSGDGHWVYIGGWHSRCIEEGPARRRTGRVVGRRHRHPDRQPDVDGRRTAPGRGGVRHHRRGVHRRPLRSRATARIPFPGAARWTPTRWPSRPSWRTGPRRSARRPPASRRARRSGSVPPVTRDWPASPTALSPRRPLFGAVSA